jgi:intraflagellar transport protein 46
VPREASKEVHRIELAHKQPGQIDNWIKDVDEILRGKHAPSVVYSRQFPDIDTLMEVWPEDFEKALSGFSMVSGRARIDSKDYAKLACALCDIPVYPQNPKKNLIESLHVLFTLYSEFKQNAHFQNAAGGPGGETNHLFM